MSQYVKREPGQTELQRERHRGENEHDIPWKLAEGLLSWGKGSDRAGTRR